MGLELLNRLCFTFCCIMSLFSSKVWGQKSSSIFRFEYFQVFNCPASLSLCVCARERVCVCVWDRPANLCLLRKSSSEESRPQKQKYLQKSFYSPSKTKQGSKKQTRVLVWSNFFGGGIFALFSPLPHTKRNYGVFYQLVQLGKYKNVYIIHEITSGIPPSIMRALK